MPFFADIGKLPKDILTAGYHFGLIKLDCNVKNNQGLAIIAGGVYTSETNKTAAYLGVKGNVDAFTLGFKYDAEVKTDDGYFTGHKITLDATAQDQYLKLASDLIIDPKTSITGGHIRNTFKDERIGVNLDTEVMRSGPLGVYLASAVHYEGLIAGYQVAYDAKEDTFTKNNLAFQYTHKNITGAVNLENQKILVLSGAYKINERADAAAEVMWNKEEDKWLVTVGGRYEIPDIKGTVGVKIDSELGLGLSYRQRVIDAVTITASALIDCNNFNKDGKHKAGLAIEVEV